MNKNELLIRCEELGIKKCKSKTKTQLIELINIALNREKHQIPMIQNTESYSFIEVCAGGGGLSSGLIKAGFNPLMLNDFDKNCCETLRKNHPGANVVLGSMESIDYSKYIGVDLLTGGVPCQSFSQAGKRKGLDDPRGDLMIKFTEILNYVKPKIFMIENVKGLLTHDSGNTIKRILELIDKDNIYNVSYKCLNSYKYGVPQKRERVFIVGVLKEFKQIPFTFPSEVLNKVVLKDVLYDVPISAGMKYSDEKIKLFKMIPQGGCWVNLPEDIQKSYLGNSYNSGGGKRGILYRLSMDKPSLTLLCSPTQKQTERCHPLEERPLTIREYARIQTFDDYYEFSGNIAEQYKQIGNAVPVELARIMGESIINFLKN